MPAIRFRIERIGCSGQKAGLSEALTVTKLYYTSRPQL
jgi:hypothetical protein